MQAAPSSASASPAALRSLYRSLTRSIRRSSAPSTSRTTKRTPTPLNSYIRSALTSPQDVPTSSLPFGGPSRDPPTTFPTTTVLQNLSTFLTNKALYLDLLERYNPSHGMSEEERVRLTARRVGLDVPITHDPSSPPSSSSSHHASTAAGAVGDDVEGSKILSLNESLFRQGAKRAAGETEAQKKRREELYSGKGDGVNRGGPLAPPGSGFVRDD